VNTASHSHSTRAISPKKDRAYHEVLKGKKTGRPVRFELTEQTRQAIDDYIRRLLPRAKLSLTARLVSTM
jgi:hypothetical protein